MKNYLIAILIFPLIGLAIGWFLQSDLIKPPSSQAVNEPVKPRATPTPIVSAAKQPKKPISLRIPSLNINVTVESVRKDEEDRMDVPKDTDNAGWYSLGSRPGEVGNAVIAGHVDNPDGSPSIFYDLKKLQIGDEIISIDEDGEEYSFEVVQVVNFPTNAFPIQEVFGATDETMLNLITCGGTWNKAAQDYSERTVVFSELKQT